MPNEPEVPRAHRAIEDLGDRLLAALRAYPWLERLRNATWFARHRVWNYLRGSLWLVPLGSMLLALLLLPALRRLDAAVPWVLLGYGLDGARAILGTLAGAMLSLVVFAFSALLITVQLASTQLTPRVIGTTLARDRRIKFTVGLMVLTFMVALGVLGRTETQVLQVSLLVTVLLSLASIAAFLGLMDYWVKALRPVSVAERVAIEGRAVIKEVYPQLLPLAVGSPPPRSKARRPAPARTVRHVGSSGVLLAADFAGLDAMARSAGGVIEVVPRVGAFIAAGEPLVHLYAGTAGIADRVLRRSFAFGPERTIEQDPQFAFRILVDIAAKALSPAINDPTTAVIAIDQIHRLLRMIGDRELDTSASSGQPDRPGVVYRTPDWEDYVNLAVSEVRLYGASTMQVARRLRAMLEHLLTVVPPHRQPPLEAQLVLLNRAVERSFADVEDRARAGIGDYQGVGSDPETMLAKTQS
jgi:uncharacterized membrane protein